MRKVPALRRVAGAALALTLLLAALMPIGLVPAAHAAWATSSRPLTGQTLGTAVVTVTVADGDHEHAWTRADGTAFDPATDVIGPAETIHTTFPVTARVTGATMSPVLTLVGVTASPTVAEHVDLVATSTPLRVADGEQHAWVTVTLTMSSDVPGGLDAQVDFTEAAVRLDSGRTWYDVAPVSLGVITATVPHDDEGGDEGDDEGGVPPQSIMPDECAPGGPGTFHLAPGVDGPWSRCLPVGALTVSAGAAYLQHDVVAYARIEGAPGERVWSLGPSFEHSVPTYAVHHLYSTVQAQIPEGGVNSHAIAVTFDSRFIASLQEAPHCGSREFLVGVRDWGRPDQVVYLWGTLELDPPTVRCEVVTAVDFETAGTDGTDLWGADGWWRNGDANLALVPDPSDPDNTVLSVTTAGQAWDGISTGQGLFTPGGEYFLAMRARLGGEGHGPEGSVSARFEMTDSTEFDWVGDTPVAADAWADVTGRWTGPDDAASFRAFTATSAPAGAPSTAPPAGTELLIDDIIVYRVVDVPEPPDHGQPVLVRDSNLADEFGDWNWDLMSHAGHEYVGGAWLLGRAVWGGIFDTNDGIYHFPMAEGGTYRFEVDVQAGSLASLGAQVDLAGYPDGEHLTTAVLADEWVTVSGELLAVPGQRFRLTTPVPVAEVLVRGARLYRLPDPPPGDESRSAT